jgi:hypothetical protein
VIFGLLSSYRPVSGYRVESPRIRTRGVAEKEDSVHLNLSPLTLVVAAAAACGVTPVDKIAPVARIQGGAISCEQLRRFAAHAQRARRGATDDLAWRRTRLEQLVVEAALEEAAVASGIDELDSVRDRWDRMRSTILTAAVNRDLAASIELDADAARRYYDAHRARFRSPERISTRLILLEVDPAASQSEIAAAAARLRQIRQEHENGETFGALARRHSEAENAARGGAVAASARGTLLPEFEEVAWSLRPGEVSDVVRLPDGLALILTERLLPPRDWQFHEVRDRIDTRLQREELARRRGEILAEAGSRWPLTIDWDRVADPAVGDRDPLLSIGATSFSLSDMGLSHRPPRLSEAIQAAVDSRWLRLWAEAQGYAERPDVAARLEVRRRTLLAAVELDRRVSARLPPAPEPELRALYENATAALTEPERRVFLAIVIPGEANKMRRARAAARRISQQWSRTGEVPSGTRVELWGPLRRMDLSAATSPLLAEAAFALAEHQISEPTLFERYGIDSSRFQPGGYVVMRVARVIQARVPTLDEVRDRLNRRLLAEQVATIRDEIESELLDERGLEIDTAALAACELPVDLRDDLGSAPGGGSGPQPGT